MDQSSVTTDTQPLEDVLAQLSLVIESLSDETYVMQPGGHFESGIGGHVRHSLDHIDAFLNALQVAGGGTGGAAVCYDARQRGTSVESDRRSALEAIGRVNRQLRQLPPTPMSQTLNVSTAVRSDGEPELVGSTVGRELVFVLSHTIHHNAMISAMAGAMGVAVPAWFGYAPSTIAFMQHNECAR